MSTRIYAHASWAVLQMGHDRAMDAWKQSSWMQCRQGQARMRCCVELTRSSKQTQQTSWRAMRRERFVWKKRLGNTNLSQTILDDFVVEAGQQVGLQKLSSSAWQLNILFRIKTGANFISSGCRSKIRKGTRNTGQPSAIARGRRGLAKIYVALWLVSPRAVLRGNTPSIGIVYVLSRNRRIKANVRLVGLARFYH